VGPGCYPAETACQARLPIKGQFELASTGINTSWPDSRPPRGGQGAGLASSPPGAYRVIIDIRRCSSARFVGGSDVCAFDACSMPFQRDPKEGIVATPPWSSVD
jgi:hypothetical protein